MRRLARSTGLRRGGSCRGRRRSIRPRSTASSRRCDPRPSTCGPSASTASRRVAPRRSVTWRRCSTTRTRTFAAGRCSCCISSGQRASAARATRRRRPTRRCASRPTARCGGPASTCMPVAARAGARQRPGRAARGRAVHARSHRGRGAADPRRRRATLRRRGPQLPRSTRHGRHGQGSGAVRRPPAGHRRGRSARVVGGVRLDRVAAASADGRRRARQASGATAAATRAAAHGRWTRSPSSTRAPPRPR